MPGCVLRVDGAEFDPDAFLATTDVTVNRVYRRGDRRSAKSVHDTGGFTVVVSDSNGDELGKQVEDAIDYLRANQVALARLHDYAGVEMVQLDFGCDFAAGGVGQFFRLPLALLTGCAALGIEIELSLYEAK